MISVELGREELEVATRIEVENPAGMLFGVTSPLLKPFMKKLEAILPVEKRGRTDSYTLSMLYSHIDSVYADEQHIQVRSGDMIVEITRDELASMMSNRHGSSDHNRLNLPGLLFLQSSPGVQAALVIMSKSEHNIWFPEGRRTRRFIFHSIVTMVDADRDCIKICLDLDRLPKKADGSSVLG